MEVEIINKMDSGLPIDCIRWFVTLLLEREDTDEETEISILFTDNENIRILNTAYRKKNKPTNVLSFSMREGTPVPFNNILGDIVISVEYAKEEAKDLEIDMRDRIIQLVIHGTLHLLGYDHIKDEDYAKMKEREDTYFELWLKEKDKCMKMRS